MCSLGISLNIHYFELLYWDLTSSYGYLFIYFASRMFTLPGQGKALCFGFKKKK